MERDRPLRRRRDRPDAIARVAAVAQRATATAAVRARAAGPARSSRRVGSVAAPDGDAERDAERQRCQAGAANRRPKIVLSHLLIAAPVVFYA